MSVKKYIIDYLRAETAEVNKLLDSHVGGDIYRPIHPLTTFVAFHKLRKKFKMEKGDSLC